MAGGGVRIGKKGRRNGWREGGKEKGRKDGRERLGRGKEAVPSLCRASRPRPMPFISETTW